MPSSVLGRERTDSVAAVPVGTALDFVPTVLILTPILMPIVKQAGIDPVYFGVLFIMNNAIGLITPPVGVVLNVVCGVARVRVEDVIRRVTPFLPAQVIVLLLLVIFPQIVLMPRQVAALSATAVRRTRGTRRIPQPRCSVRGRAPSCSESCIKCFTTGHAGLA